MNRYVNESEFPPFSPYLLIFLSVAVLAIILFLKIKRDRNKQKEQERLIEKQNRFKVKLNYDPIKIAYHLLFYAYKQRNIDETPVYFLKTYFEQKENSPDNDSNNSYWKVIFEIHAKNLITCLNRDEISFEEIPYFDRLRKDRFENTINPRYNEKIFGEVVGQAKMWAFTPNMKQQAARLGSLAHKFGLSTPVKKGYEERQDHWNTVLGLRKKEKINVKYLFDDPFKVSDVSYKAKEVYKHGKEIYKFLKDTNLEDECKIIKEHFKVKIDPKTKNEIEDDFSAYRKESDFS